MYQRLYLQCYQQAAQDVFEEACVPDQGASPVRESWWVTKLLGKRDAEVHGGQGEGYPV